MIGLLAAALLAATPCEGLKAVSFAKATITTAEFVQEGVHTPPPPPPGSPPPPARKPGDPPPATIIAPAHCRVVAVLKPSADSLINMELWLPPSEKWNGKFEAIGNGGWAGSIQGLGAQPGNTPPMV